MIILVLTVDSFSRRHFFRKLPETVKFLNQLRQEQKYAVFDFKLHNIIGANTPENTSRIFQAKLPKYTESAENENSETLIWNILKDLGFTTMIGFDS